MAGACSPRPRAREFGIATGLLEPGALNAITDVSGVKVGHVTLSEGSIRTGVTAIIPHEGNLFRDKVHGAFHVINGYGKATGMAQIQELGTIETPVVLTNTLSVGAAWDALCGYMMARTPEIGLTAGTVNPVVAECNDGYLNDIRGRHVKAEHVLEALEKACGGPVQEGNVGAGTGMSCLGFKGGIGTSSRKLKGAISDRHLGVLVLSNFGGAQDLLVSGVPVGVRLAELRRDPPAPPGSIITVVATDAPLSDRQLERVAKRCQGGLARVGSTFSNGSGDFVLAFSTKDKVAHTSSSPFEDLEEPFIRDDSLEMASLFRASIEATEEAVLNALFAAETMTGREGHQRRSLPLDDLAAVLREHRALL
ncbi:MAG: P1 family peptidase [Bacillota bacterium]